MAFDRTQSYSTTQQDRKDDIATVVATIDRQEAKYADLLPSNVRWADFRNSFLVSVQMTPRLLEADRQSLFLALQKCAGDGLKPDGREAALVIFGDDAEDEDGNPVPSTAKGKKKVVYMPMIRGLIKLVRNTGNVTGVRAKLLYRGESILISDENGVETYKHVRTIGEASDIDDRPENIIGAYAVITYRDGTFEMEAMTRAQINRVRAVSRSKKGPWLTWADEMSKKTVLRRLIKRVDQSNELQRLDAALTHDETLGGPTIDGEATSEIMTEFSAEKQAAKPVTTQTAAPKQTAPATNSSVDTSRQAEAVRSSPPSAGGVMQDRVGPSGGAGSGQPTQPPSDEQEIDIWALEDTGEPVDSPEPMTPIEFANWFASRLFASTNPLALREHNADNIGEAGQHPESRQIITDAVARHERAEAEKAAPSPQNLPNTQETAAPPPRKRVPIAIPKTPRGKEHWPNYGPLAFAEVENLTDEADIQDWIAVNRPTYKNTATEIAIDNRIRLQRAKLGAAAHPGPPAAVLASDAEMTSWVAGQVSWLTTAEQVRAWSMSPPVRAAMLDWKKRSPEAFAKGSGLVDERLMALEVPT